MESTKAILSVLLVATYGFGQGTVSFKNDGVSIGGDHHVYFYMVGGTKAVGTNLVAELYYGNAGTSASELTPLVASISKFRVTTTTFPGTWSGKTVYLPIGGVGTSIVLDVRVWDSTLYPTYEAARETGFGWSGESGPFTYNQIQSSPPLTSDQQMIMMPAFALWYGGLPPLSPDPNAVDTDGFKPDPNGEIRAIGVASDGKILIGGSFTNVNGQASGRLARLNADGSLDATFNPFANDSVSCLGVQADGKFLVGGDFTSIAGQPRNRLARFYPGGPLDFFFTSGADGPVTSVAVQTDGKILVGGSFATLGGWPRRGLGRLTTYGNVDTSLDPSTDGSVASLLRQPDGRLLVGGAFRTIAGWPCTNLARFNLDGSLDRYFAPMPDGAVNAMGCQADGKIIVGGLFQHLGNQTRSYLGRLQPDGTLDQEFDPGADAPVSSLAVERDGSILVGGSFGLLGGFLRKGIGRLHSDGKVDAAFDLNSSNASVKSLAVAADGNLLAGGAFTTLGGQSRTNMGRFFSDGTLDKSLLGGAGSVHGVAIQPDGKILLAGLGRFYRDGNHDDLFSSALGGPYSVSVVQPDGKILVGDSSLARLHPDGSPDNGFQVMTGNGPGSGTIYALATQSDGRILVGGYFTSLNGEPRSCVGRVNASGILDETFNPGADGQVRSLVVQPDGKILISGSFSVLSGHVQSGFGRLEANGNFDPSFAPAFSNNVYCFVTQPDGQILVGGNFVALSGTRGGIARLHADGSQDANFGLRVSGSVMNISLQTDGKILIAGSFSGPSLTNLARLNADGSFDTAFTGDVKPADHPDLGQISGLIVEPDGKVLVGGAFNLVNGLARTNLARVSETSAALQSLVLDDVGATLTWKRSGSSPEIEQVTFEVSLDATNYLMLGPGVRISGGWQLGGPVLPVGVSFLIRARGRCVASGFYGGYHSVVESVAQFYQIVPPRLNAAPVLGSGFIFTNPSLAGFSVLRATNISAPLSNWTVLGQPWPVGGGVYQFSDPGAANISNKFYRLRSP